MKKQWKIIINKGIMILTIQCLLKIYKLNHYLIFLIFKQQIQYLQFNKFYGPNVDCIMINGDTEFEIQFNSKIGQQKVYNLIEFIYYNGVNIFTTILLYNKKQRLLMTDQYQMKRYQQMSKIYKEIVDIITTKQLAQVKYYLTNTLQKRIQSKSQSIFQQYTNVKDLMQNLKQAKGKVILHFAAAKGDVQIVKYLIQQIKVDHKIKDKQGNNAFFTAIEHGHVSLVSYFIQQLKYSANQTKQGQISTLHIAANSNHTQLIQYLLKKGANIQKVSIYGKPLNWAVGSSNIDAIKILLQNGADPNGDTTGTQIAPIILAVDFNNKQLYDLLIAKGANIKIKDPAGYGLLHVAAQKGQLQIVKDLVTRGLQFNQQIQGKTPLYLAFQNQKWQVVNYFRDHDPDFSKIQQKINKKLEQQAKQRVQPDKQKAQQFKKIGNQLYGQKKIEQALVQYKKALKYDPQNIVIHRNLAAAYLALKMYEQTIFHCHQSKKHEKNVKTSYREAQAYQGLHNYIDAASALWQCCLLQPQNKFFKQQFQKTCKNAKQKYNKTQN